VAVLDPDVVLRADTGVAGASTVVRGAAAVARQALMGASRNAELALVNGAVGIVRAPKGRPTAVMGLTISRGKIVEIDILVVPERLRRLAAPRSDGMRE
jgi:RNA polymerase sigma-70 factor (ECF subfamily)